MIKNFLLSLLVVCSFHISCYASIDNEQIALGGLRLASNVDYALKIYGQPRLYNTKPSYGDLQIEYGDSFHLYYFAESRFTDKSRPNNYLLKCVFVDKDNGISTPAGIKVGSSESMLWECYGRPDDCREKNGQMIYMYMGNTYSRDRIYFAVKDKQVTCITCDIYW